MEPLPLRQAAGSLGETAESGTINNEMKKNRKHILLILLGITSIFVSCNRPIPFNKEKWMRCGGWEGDYFISDDYFVSGNTRYRMALWLEKNYNFCDKSFDEILDKFYITPAILVPGQARAFEQVKNDKILKITKKQYNPNFLGIDPMINTDWIEIHFDESFMVSKVYYVHQNPKTKERTERKICENNVLKER